MKNYIGIDAHCKYCDVAVVSEDGKLLSHLSVKTSAQNLIEAVKKVRGDRAVVVEESTLADWLQRTLLPYCGQFQVCDPKENDRIARSEKKSDRHDAQALAQLYRGGYTKAVHHTQDMRHYEMKESVRYYHDCVNQVVRRKNKLKALYRRHGIFLVGDRVYDPSEGAKYLELLSDPTSRQNARDHLCVLAMLERLKVKAERRMKRLGSRIGAVALLMSIPGVGLVVAATVVAIVETPHRFPAKEYLWKYAGLAIATSESGGKSKTGHASKEGNRLLKKVLMQAALSASKGDNRFGRRYRELSNKRGSSIAQRTVARSILATMYGMWKTGELYREQA
jgi:transposase